MGKRSHIGLKTKLAAAVCQILQIPHADAMAMSENQALSLANFDHYPRRVVDGGTDDFWNLYVRAIPEHRTKTAKIDVPQIRKADRIKARDVRMALARARPDLVGSKAVWKSKWPQGRKLQSRNTFKRRGKTKGRRS